MSSRAARPNPPVRLPLSDSRGLATARRQPRRSPLRRASERLWLLRQRGSRSATRVPRNGRERFRTDTVDDARNTRRTAHFPVHHCTVFSAPRPGTPSGVVGAARTPLVSRARDRELSLSGRDDAPHTRRRCPAPALSRHGAGRRRSRPSRLHKKQCSARGGRPRLRPRPPRRSARWIVAFGPRRRRAGGLAFFLPSPSARSVVAPRRLYRIRDEEDDFVIPSQRPNLPALSAGQCRVSSMGGAP